MGIPAWVLLGFAGWTLAALIGSVGVHRWSRILTRRSSVREWRADEPQGPDWYRRAMRAHMNCVENLPVYGAVVVALIAGSVSGPILDGLAITLLAARVAQTSVHIALVQTEAIAILRFSLYFVQVSCMVLMGLAAAGLFPPA